MKKGPGHHNQGPLNRLEESYPMRDANTTNSRESTWVLYDLRDPVAWERAGRDRRVWGRELSEIYDLDNDHIVIEFKAGGALEASA